MKSPYKPVDLPRDTRASQLPPSNSFLFWAIIVNSALFAVLGFAVYAVCF